MSAANVLEKAVIISSSGSGLDEALERVAFPNPQKRM
jgi:hypothetical protein